MLSHSFLNNKAIFFRSLHIYIFFIYIYIERYQKFWSAKMGKLKIKEVKLWKSFLFISIRRIRYDIIIINLANIGYYSAHNKKTVRQKEYQIFWYLQDKRS